MNDRVVTPAVRRSARNAGSWDSAASRFFAARGGEPAPYPFGTGCVRFDKHSLKTVVAELTNQMQSFLFAAIAPVPLDRAVNIERRFVRRNQYLTCKVANDHTDEAILTKQPRIRLPRTLAEIVSAIARTDQQMREQVATSANHPR